MIFAAAFVPSLLTTRLAQVRLIDLLALSSLTYTAYMLTSMPNSKPQKAQLSHLGRPFEAGSGPLKRSIDYLNGILSLLVLLNAFSYRGRQGVHEGFWLVCVLPFSEL